MHRRAFLETMAATPLLAQSARPQTGNASGIKLGFDTYSLRAFGWKDMRLIDFAANLKCDTLQISDSADYSSIDPTHLKQVRDYAAKFGIEIDAGIGCICPLSKSWKAELGTPEDVIAEGLRVAFQRRRQIHALFRGNYGGSPRFASHRGIHGGHH